MSLFHAFHALLVCARVVYQIVSRKEILSPQQLYELCPTKRLSNKDIIEEGSLLELSTFCNSLNCPLFFAGAIVFEIDPALKDAANNKSGVGPAFGHVTNPFGKDVDVLWQDPPKKGKEAVSQPEPIQRKFLALSVDPHQKFTRKYEDGRIEEYHCVKYNEKGSHWEVWSEAQVNSFKADLPPPATTPTHTFTSFKANLN